MFKRVLSFAISALCITMFAGVGIAAADVLPPNAQGNSISVTHDDGHTTVIVVTNGRTVVAMDPPIGGP